MRLRGLFSRGCDFYQMLADQAARTLEGVETLHQFVTSMEAGPGARVKAIEEEADEIRRILIQELNRTFVTPIDREDIFSLSRAIDDVIDYCTTTVYEFESEATFQRFLESWKLDQKKKEYDAQFGWVSERARSAYVQVWP